MDLFAHWKYHYRPVRRVSRYSLWDDCSLIPRQLVFMTLELLIGIAVGYIPCKFFDRALVRILTRLISDVDNFGID